MGDGFIVSITNPSQRRRLCLVAIWILEAGLYAESKTLDLSEQQRFFEKLNPYWSFLWTGFWEHEKYLINRGDLRIHISRENLSLRTQLIDKRPVPPWEEPNAGITAFSGGLYHEKTGSRILYGILDEWGLPARLRNPWIRSLPFVDHHKPSMVDLKTEPSSTKEPETYLYLGSPQWGIFKGFASVLVDTDLNPAVAGGCNLQFNAKTNLQLEGFYTGQTLPPRTAASWFSNAPPLPEREFRLYALGMVYNGPFLGIAADWAYSDTFAYGRDLYGNLGLRIGNRPWQVLLAADGAGSRFVGRDGSAPGAGFRIGARFEHYGKKNRLFRFGTSLRSDGLGEPFERSSTLISYRFPSGFGSLPVKPARISLNLARNASDITHIEDKAEATVGITWGPLGSAVSGTLTGISSAPEQPVPFPIPNESSAFSSAKISGEVSYRLGLFQFKVKLGYTLKKDKEPLGDAAFHVAVRGIWGRLGLQIASLEFPSAWTYTVSWRLQKK